MSILIIGGTKGIGLAIAKAFARESGEVFLNYHSDDTAAGDAAEQVSSSGGRPYLIKADVGSPDGCATIIRLSAKGHSASIRSCTARSTRMPQPRLPLIRRASRAR